MAIIEVGPSKALKTASEAFKIAKAGDTVKFDAGVYSGPAAVSRIVSPGTISVEASGPVVFNARDASNKAYNVWNHGIWSAEVGELILRGDITFTGAAVAVNQGNNGSGIKMVSGSLDAEGVKFFYNQSGILANTGNFKFSQCHFAFNGDGFGQVLGTGQTHNIYIVGGSSKLIMDRCISRNARGGQCVKSRAEVTQISYCVLGESTPVTNGNSNFEVDLCNGGDNSLIGNLILQNTGTTNGHVISIGAEGINKTVNNLRLIHNTIVGYRSINYFARVVAPTAITSRNNLFAGNSFDQNSMFEGSQPVVSKGDYYSKDILTVKFSGDKDYRLATGSPALGKGITDTDLIDIVSQIGKEFTVEPRTAWTTPGAFELGALKFPIIPVIPVPDPGVPTEFVTVSSGDPTPTPVPTPTPTPVPTPVPGTSKVIGVIVLMPDGSVRLIEQ